MKTLSIFLLCLACYHGRCQLTEKFSDSDLTRDPAWSGSRSLADFTVAQGQLRSNSGTPNSSFYISTVSTMALDCQWEVSVTLDFNPSGSNFADIYLCADREDLLSPALSGYFVRLGGTADELALYRRNGPNLMKLIDGADGALAFPQNTLKIRVRRTADGMFTLEHDMGLKDRFTTEGSATDMAIRSSSFFGISVQQSTASFFFKHFFDDIRVGPIVPDAPLAARTYSVLISELMADPSPPQQLPDAEYVELYNFSDTAVNLEGLTISDSETSFKFREGTIGPKSYLLLCAEKDTALFRRIPGVRGIHPWPSLNNDHDIITLQNNVSQEIHRVAYDTRWYKDAGRKNGGWSLELISTASVCSGIQNWTSSISSAGGTPGDRNSVNDDSGTARPFLISKVIAADSALTLYFTRSPDSSSAAIRSHYELNNGIGNPVRVLPVGPDFLSVRLFFSNALARGNRYTVSTAGITDCSGVPLPEAGRALTFLFPEKVKPGDLLISEILFNPREGGEEFLEFYNASGHTLDIGGLQVALLDGRDSVVKSASVTPEQFLVEPGTYYVLTPAPDAIQREYRTGPPGHFLTAPAMPALNNTEGRIAILSGNLVIDRLNYHERMHFPLLRTAKGVSLERGSFKRSADETGNFRSASSAAGFGTPALVNSQAEREDAAAPGVNLSSLTFSPDNDGFEDVLLLYYDLEVPDCVMTVSFYNRHGLSVRKLSAGTAGLSGTIVWDGLDDNRELAEPGVYLVLVEVFNPAGHYRRFRKTCVLAQKSD
jgi:hypothetical protein